MRRFILGWKTLGHARRFGAEIVNYADDFVISGQALTAAMWVVVERMVERLRLPLNATKTRCLRGPEEPWSSSGTACDATTTRARERPTSARARDGGACAVSAARSMH